MSPLDLIPLPYRLAAGAAALALVAGAVATNVWYVSHLQHEVADLKVAKVVAKDQATVTTAQTAAVAAGAAIAEQGARRDALSITLHQDNAHAIDLAPGASASVDPAVNDAGRRGLCKYASYAHDPGCAGLHQGDPAELPGTGGSDHPAVPVG